MNRLGYVVAALVLLFFGKAWGERREPEVVTRVDSVTPARYAETLAGMRLENDGLRARLRGIESRPPRVIVRTDTVVAPPDTVYRFVNVDSRGSLSVEVLHRADSVYVPELHTGSDISDCDDGWQIRDGEVLCDKARLGHLYVGPWLSTHPALAVWWTPSYRSPWEASISYSGKWEIGVRRGLRLW